MDGCDESRMKCKNYSRCPPGKLITRSDLNSNGPIPFSNCDKSFSMGTAAMNSNSTCLSVVAMVGIIANWPASVPASGLLARTDSDVRPSIT